MIHKLILLTIVVCIVSQPGILKTTALNLDLFRATTSSEPSSEQPADPNAPPSASATMDTSSSDQANLNSTSSSLSARRASAGTAYMMSYALSSGANTFNDATNAWNYLQKIGGGCCSSCKNICGFGIKIAGTSYYLTNRGYWFNFVWTSSPGSNQIFNLSQNSDCTWSFANNGIYLSTSSIYSGSWVGTSSSIGVNERWYIERNNGYVAI